jgi:hypothetical protein
LTSSPGKTPLMRALFTVSLAICLVSLLWDNPLQADGRHLASSISAKATRPHTGQTRCPVMGGPIDRGLYVDAHGKRVYLCCAACADAVRVEPDMYIEKIRQRGETVEATPKPASTPL